MKSSFYYAQDPFLACNARSERWVAKLTSKMFDVGFEKASRCDLYLIREVNKSASIGSCCGLSIAQVDQICFMLQNLYEVKAQGGDEQGEDTEVDNEVFRQQYIPQNLQQVYDIERDGDKIKQGTGGDLVYQDLLANKKEAEDDDEEKDGDEESDSDDDEFSDSERKPRGKRFEDKEVKKEHKKAVKEEKRERRKEKMPKHLKKKLVNQSSRGKKWAVAGWPE